MLGRLFAAADQRFERFEESDIERQCALALKQDAGDALAATGALHSRARDDRIDFPGRSLLSTVVDLPFAIPTLVAGVMLVALYGPSSVVGGWLERHGINIVFAPAGILLALLFVTLPLVVRSVQPVLLELDLAEE